MALVGFGASWVAMNNPGRLGSIQLNEPKSQLVGAGLSRTAGAWWLQLPWMIFVPLALSREGQDRAVGAGEPRGHLLQ